jgi:hypothetical protein
MKNIGLVAFGLLALVVGIGVIAFAVQAFLQD